MCSHCMYVQSMSAPKPLLDFNLTPTQLRFCEITDSAEPWNWRMRFDVVFFGYQKLGFCICGYKCQPTGVQTAWRGSVPDPILPLFQDAALILFSPDEFSCSFPASAIKSRPLEIQASGAPHLEGVAGEALNPYKSSLISNYPPEIPSGGADGHSSRELLPKVVDP